MSDAGKAEARLLRWMEDPRQFVVEAFELDDSTPARRITAQQEQGLEAYRRLLVGKLKRARGRPLTPQEAKDADRIGLVVHSGHGTGKTAFAAWCLLHFLVTRPYCKIPCVAPVGPQLKTNLWPEVHLWIRKSPILKDIITWQAEKIYHNDERGREWFAVPRTVNVKATAEEQAETLAGIHADNMLIIVDEASGVPDPVFRPLEGGLTGPCNFVLQIGNPTQMTGFFHDSFTRGRADWLVCHWNAEESVLVQPSQIARMARKYGTDSNAYRIRVKGLPPTATPDTLIPWDWVMRAVNCPVFPQADDPWALGIDVARYGDDSSVLVSAQGPVVGSWDAGQTMIQSGISELKGTDSKDIAYTALREIEERAIQCAAIDVNGYGAGAYDLLKDLAPIVVLAVNVGESAEDPERFARLRDELWWRLREEFQAGTLAIPDDADLIGEISTIKYNFTRTAKERVKIESKQDLRDRGLASPNKADALMLARYAKRFTTRASRPARRRWRDAENAWIG